MEKLVMKSGAELCV